MTPSDLERIETALEVQLPPVYKRSMTSFPIPYLCGNDDTDLWDSADALIQ